MDSLLADIRGKTTLNSINNVKTSILDCARHIKSDDATFKISTLPNISDRLASLMTDHVKNVQRFEACQKVFLKYSSKIDKEDDNLEDGEYSNIREYQDTYKQSIEEELSKASKSRDSAHTDLQKIMGHTVDDEIQVEAPSRQIPKDPITKKDIKIAVMSKVCKHIYDKDGIEDYFQQKERAKKTRIQCPQAGCTNKTMTREELVLDEETNKLIQSL